MGLVRYPATPAPVTGTENVITQCTENAHSTSPSLTVTCTSSGAWTVQTPVCECDAGYVSTNVNGIEICQG